jgi:hypothetical protein
MLTVGLFYGLLVSLAQENYGVARFGLVNRKTDSLGAVGDQEEILIPNFTLGFGTLGDLV